MVLSNYIKSKLNGFENVPDDFEWLEEKKENKKKRLTARASTKYYYGFRLNKLRISEGDCVFINIRPSYGSALEFEVARILECYSDENEKVKGFVKVQWYIPIDKVRKPHLKSIPAGLPPLDGDLEIVKDLRVYETSVDLETISALCCVMEVKGVTNPDCVKRPDDAVGRMYVCRFQYTKSSPWILPFKKEQVYVSNTKNTKLFPALAEISNSPKHLSARGVTSWKKKEVPGRKNLSAQFSSEDDIFSPAKEKSRVKRKLLDPDEDQENVLKKTKTRTDSPSQKRSSFTEMFTNLISGKLNSPSKNENVKKLCDFRGLETTEIFDLLSDDEHVPKSERSTRKSARKSTALRPYYISSSEDEGLGRYSPVGQKKSGVPLQIAETWKEVVISSPKRIPKPSQRYNDSYVKMRSPSCAKRRLMPSEDHETPREAGNDTPNERSREGTPDTKGKERTPAKKKKKESTLAKVTRQSTPLKLSKESTPVKTRKGTPIRTKKDAPNKINKGTPIKTKKDTPIKTKKGTPIKTNIGTPIKTNQTSTPVKKEDRTKRAPKRTPSGKSTNKSKKSTASRKKEPPAKKGSKEPPAQSCVTAKAKTRVSRLPGRTAPVSGVATEFEQARAQLHVSAVPALLPCREEEFHQIYSFVEGKLLDSTGGCMYVSGVPGTGKTATVREVVRLLREGESEGAVPQFEFLEVNAMKLTKPNQLWVQIWEGLTEQRVTPEHAYALLDKSLGASAGPKARSIFLLLDELDLLWTRKQDVMYNLFELSSRVESRFIVVTIANTMDLPERMMVSRVSSRLGLTRMTFHPYTFKQLQEIIASRLCGIKAFDPDAIQLVARKVAAVSGDARRALDICRRATELAEQDKKDAVASPKKSPRKRLTVLVGMSHVSQATSEMFSSPKIMAIRRCSQMDKYLLQSILMEFARTGIEEAVLSRVLDHLRSVCGMEGLPPPSSSSALLLLSGLSSQRVVFTDHSRRDLALRIRLNISTEDVAYALSL